MIELSYQELNSKEFNTALATLSKQTFKSFQTSYNVARILKQVGKELDLARELFLKFSEEYFVKDENGKHKLAEQPTVYSPWEIVPEKKQEYLDKVENFLSTKVTIQSHKIKFDELENTKLTPQQVIALEVIFDSESFAQQLSM